MLAEFLTQGSKAIQKGHAFYFEGKLVPVEMSLAPKLTFL